jgi:hypothetical protein
MLPRGSGPVVAPSVLPPRRGGLSCDHMALGLWRLPFVSASPHKWAHMLTGASIPMAAPRLRLSTNAGSFAAM